MRPFGKTPRLRSEQQVRGRARCRHDALIFDNWIPPHSHIHLGNEAADLELSSGDPNKQDHPKVKMRQKHRQFEAPVRTGNEPSLEFVAKYPVLVFPPARFGAPQVPQYEQNHGQ